MMNRPNKAPIGSYFPKRSLYKGDPFTPLSVRDNFSEIVDDFFNDFFNNKQSVKDRLVSKGKIPKTDVYSVEEDGGRKLVFSFAIPGINPEDLDLEADFENGTISIKYNKDQSEKDIGKSYILKEMSHASFVREFGVSKEVVNFDTEEDIKVKFDSGILELKLTYKQEEKEPEKTKVKKLKIE